MYVILVTEPGSETEQHILPTATRTLDSAMQLMQHRAEEWISEQVEINGDEAEDYNLVLDIPGCVQVVSANPATVAEPAHIAFEAAAITEVV